ncbi:MAG: hypothetical protein NDJ89_19100 [Oligoflexia bacterium]|nr:hypothetical protein [Oligoflexia bacterium]
MLSAIGEDGYYTRIEGRTGILLKDGLPVIVRRKDTGEELVVELKGAGQSTAMGGYKSDKDRGILGGLQKVPGLREFERLEKTVMPGTVSNNPLAGALSAFDGPYGPQALLVRLAPGTVRATFSGAAFRGRAEATNRIAHGMGAAWGRHLANGDVPLSHPENLIVSQDYTRFFETDMSDIVAIRRFPTSWGHHYRRPLEVVESSIHSVQELEGYDPTITFQSFKNGLIGSWKESGKLRAEALPELEKAQDTLDLARRLWQHHLGHKYYHDLHEQGWVPDKLKYIEFSEYKLGTPEHAEEIERKLRDLLRDWANMLSYNEREAALTSPKADSYRYRQDQLRRRREANQLLDQWREGSNSITKLLFSPGARFDPIQVRPVDDFIYDIANYVDEASSLRTLFGHLKNQREFLTMVKIYRSFGDFQKHR